MAASAPGRKLPLEPVHGWILAWTVYPHQRYAPVPHAIEGGFAQDQHAREVQTHLPQSAGEDEVETTPTVDEHLGEPDLCHHWIQDQGELAGLRKAHPLIIAGERGGDLRLME
jgi:hypothetical protein